MRSSSPALLLQAAALCTVLPIVLETPRCCILERTATRADAPVGGGHPVLALPATPDAHTRAGALLGPLNVSDVTARLKAAGTPVEQSAGAAVVAGGAVTVRALTARDSHEGAGQAGGAGGLVVEGVLGPAFYEARAAAHAAARLLPAT